MSAKLQVKSLSEIGGSSHVIYIRDRFRGSLGEQGRNDRRNTAAEEARDYLVDAGGGQYKQPHDIDDRADNNTDTGTRVVKPSPEQRKDDDRSEGGADDPEDAGNASSTNRSRR